MPLRILRTQKRKLVNLLNLKRSLVSLVHVESLLERFSILTLIIIVDQLSRIVDNFLQHLTITVHIRIGCQIFNFIGYCCQFQQSFQDIVQRNHGAN